MANKILRVLLAGIIVSLTSLNSIETTDEIGGFYTLIGDETVETQIETDEPMTVIASHYDVIEALKNEIHETQNWDENCSDSTLQISQEDAYALMKVSTAEAASEGVLGELKIMQVVMNRVASDDYPDSAVNVIEQKDLINGKWRWQFCTVRDGIYQDTEPDLNSHLALAMLEKNENQDTSIIAFETSTNGNTLTEWFDIAYQYRNHIFYTKKED